MQPFRTSPAAAPPCTQCGAARADCLSNDGEPLCKGCAVTAEANARLGAGRRSGRIGAFIGIFVGSALILTSIWWAVTTFEFALESHTFSMTARIFCGVFAVGILILSTSVHNLRGLAPRA
jgi:hypothetical protein